MSLVLDRVCVVRDAGTPWEAAALDDVTLRATPGDRLVVVGGNGAGKSTLAWVLAGALAPTSGTSTLDGRPLVDRQDEIGFVVQHARLQLQRPTIVAELARYGVRGDAAAAALDRVGLRRALLRSRVEELSVGQQRRVALAVALARAVPLLVLDEPLAGLDRPGVAAIEHALASVGRDTVVVVVSHEPGTVDRLGGHAIRLVDGRIVGTG